MNLQATAHSHSILLVEDDLDIQRLEKFLLESFGYSVQTATNGKEAIARLQSKDLPPDLILLDLMLPEMNGWEFLKERAQIPAARKIPVVIVSAIGDPNAAIAQHANRVLTKPFSFGLLVNSIQELCQT